MDQQEKDYYRANPFEALRIAQQIREYHHKALWEEEKHFLWLNSIILAAQAAILTKSITEVPYHTILLISLAAIGLLFALIALRVIRREGVFFVDANKIFVAQYNMVFSTHKLPVPSGVPNKSIYLLPFFLFSQKLSIRDAFQLVLLVFAIVNAVLLVSVWIGLI